MRRLPTAGALGAIHLLAAGATGCERDMVPAICPAAGAGGLVITEIRGNQSGTTSDTLGQWIELYNASGGDLDLEGLTLDLRRLDGSDQGLVRVRRSLPVAAGAYVVLGRFDDATRPAYVDYGWAPDLLTSSGQLRDIVSAGAIDADACEQQVDRVVFEALPAAGTYALGVSPPDADANDAAAAWCTDASDDDDPITRGLPGSPGEANPPCP